MKQSATERPPSKWEVFAAYAVCVLAGVLLTICVTGPAATAISHLLGRTIRHLPVINTVTP